MLNRRFCWIIFWVSLQVFSSVCRCNAAMPMEPMRRAPEVSGPVWFNTEDRPPISLKSLRGEVVLVLFWTSNDFQSHKAIAAVNDLYVRYKERGFEVIGVHASEWSYDVSEGAVLAKIRELGIQFPVVMDVDSSVWLAYKQSGWPSLYLIDRKGFIRGEYGYRFAWQDAELMLQILLEEGRSRLFDRSLGRNS